MDFIAKAGVVDFPPPRDRNVNMMPFVLGDRASLPDDLADYWHMIEEADCTFEPGRIAYLTVQESWVRVGETQRRPGIHTDGTAVFGWGGGAWGGGISDPQPAKPPPKPANPWPRPWPNRPSEPLPKKNGIYTASTDGRCCFWNEARYDVDTHGALLAPPVGTCLFACPSTLYWLTDRTPHESLPAQEDGYRQFFRVVSHEIGVWFTRHNTPNPLGVKSDVIILDDDKFAH